MKKFLTISLALLFCLGLVTAPISAKSARNETPQARETREAREAKIEKSERGAWLGVYTQSVDEDLADAFEIDVDYGAIVNEVIDDSPAKKAGLKDGDVIISFNDRKVWDQDDLIDFIEDSEAGSTANLGIIRDGNNMTVTVELGKRPRTVISEARAPRAPNTVWIPSPNDKDVNLFSWGGGGYVGVGLSELTGQLAEYFGVKEGHGALITEVSEKSPAEKAGLKAGDVITKIGSEEIEGYAQVKEIVSASDEGDKLEFTIVRNKKPQTLQVEVAENKQNDFGYQFFTVPPMPDVDMRVPRGIARFNYDDKEGHAYFDYDSYKESMEKFQADMERYKEEMRALSKDMKNLKRDDQSALKDQIEELKAQIRELEKRIQ